MHHHAPHAAPAVAPFGAFVCVQATHFATELVQNADDCRYMADEGPTTVFVLEEQGKRLTVMNNEAGDPFVRVGPIVFAAFSPAKAAISAVWFTPRFSSFSECPNHHVAFRDFTAFHADPAVYMYMLRTPRRSWRPKEGRLRGVHTIADLSFLILTV